MSSLCKDAASGGLADFRIVIPATFDAVSDALQRLVVSLCDHVSRDLIDDAEIVLAEVMNNVAEHAYPDGHPGQIELTVRVRRGQIDCTVVDSGIPFPGGNAPPEWPGCRAPETDTPEGGYGWPLIHALARYVTYDRLPSGGTPDRPLNRLSLVIGPRPDGKANSP
jgi:serine/threonine-protein kinase RsbW